MNAIGLFQVEKGVTSRLLNCEDLPKTAVKRFSRPAHLLETLERDPSELDVVVLGKNTPEPVRLAQKIQALDKFMAVTILDRPENHEELRNAIRFSPFLNGAVRCETISEERPAGHLAQILLDAASGTRQRRTHLAQVAASRERLAEQAPPQPQRTAYLEHFFDTAPIGMMVLDADQRIVAYNNAANAALDAEVESLVQTALTDYFPDEEAALLEGFIRQCACMRTTCTPAFFKVREEPERVLQITVSAFRNLVGAPSGAEEDFAVVFLQDATALAQAEREARELAAEAAVIAARQESEARYQELFDIAPVGYHQLDSDGRIVRVNRTEQQMLGYESEEMIGRPIWEFAADPDLSRQTVREKLQGKRRVDHNLERNYRRKDGSIVPILIENRLLYDDDDNITGMLSTFQDITPLKIARRQLEEHTRALQESNRELEQFAYVASHDLREPLRMISGYVELLGKRYKGKLDPEADEFIGFALDGARRMRDLIRDLLLYSRVGTRSKTPRPVDMNNILDEVLLNLKVVIEENDAEISRGPLPVVNADATQMIQLFQNLIGNAIKFRGAQSPAAHITAAKTEDHWTFSIRDNGIGIEPDAAKRIFLIFQQLHRVTEYAGTGIGLAICQKIVERHSGKIWVESTPGKGATFRFTLPIVKQREEIELQGDPPQ